MIYEESLVSFSYLSPYEQLIKSLDAESFKHYYFAILRPSYNKESKNSLH